MTSLPLFRFIIHLLLLFIPMGMAMKNMGLMIECPMKILRSGRHIPDIDSFVYAFGKKDVVNIYDHLQNRAQYAVSGKVADNSFTKWLMKNKDVEALQYLCFAKTCEQYTTPLEAQWDDKTSGYILPGRDANAMGALVDEGQKGYNAAKSGEIKLRYTYQVLRMAFYSGIALMKRDITLIPLKTRTYSN
jgi:hypothetical protein